jgi:chromosome segregation ATPase
LVSTKAQQTYERINALVDGGKTKADAFKQLAEEYAQPVDSVRGAYYGHKRVLERGDEPSTRAGDRASARRSRKRETTTQDAVASAVATLRAAIGSIEVELETARERADEAQAEYEAMRSASSGRIEEIRAKIAVLDPEAGDESPATAAFGSDATAPRTEGKKPDASKPASRKEAAGS